MSNAAREFVDAVATGKTHEASEIFNTEVTSRVGSTLDTKRIEVASSMAVGDQTEEE